MIGHRLHRPTGADWALVRLDRPVTDHRVASVRRRGSVAERPGRPRHRPSRRAAPSRSPATRPSPTTPQSAFFLPPGHLRGHSGSPVFNSQTHEVEGILVRGPPDFQSPSGRCNVSAVYPSTGPGGSRGHPHHAVRRLLGPGWQHLDDNALTTADRRRRVGAVPAAQQRAALPVHRDADGGLGQADRQQPADRRRSPPTGAELYQLHAAGRSTVTPTRP